MKKKMKATHMYFIYCGVTALLFIMMKTVREIYRVDIAELNSLQLVLVGTTLEITHFIFEVPTGIIADKYSRKLSIVVGLFLIGISILIEGFFPIFLIIILTQLILGIGDTFTSGADEAWIADELDGESLAPVLLKGTQVGQWASIIGTIISIFLGQYIIRLPYLISGSLFIVLGVFIIRFMKESKIHIIKTTDNPYQHMKNSISLVFQLIKSNKILFFMVLITFFHGLYSEGIDRFWTPYFIKEITLPTDNTVLYIGFISLCAMLLSIVTVEYIKRRLQKTQKLEQVWLLFIINILMVFTLFSFAITKQFFVAASLYILFYTVRRVNQPIYKAWMNAYIPSQIRATVLSSYGQIDSIGQIIGGPIIGLIALYTSISFGILFASILLSPVIIIYIYLIIQVREKENS